MLKLYHGTKLIGTIHHPTQEGLWMEGDVELTPAAAPYKEVFAFLVDEDRLDEDPPFSEELLDNWFVEDESGGRKEIGAPGVHSDGEINWRYV